MVRFTILEEKVCLMYSKLFLTLTQPQKQLTHRKDFCTLWCAHVAVQSSRNYLILYEGIFHSSSKSKKLKDWGIIPTNTPIFFFQYLKIYIEGRLTADYERSSVSQVLSMSGADPTHIHGRSYRITSSGCSISLFRRNYVKY